MINLLLISVFLALAGYFKGRLDAIADEGVKKDEWENKYRRPLIFPKNHWWYFGLYAPKFQEKFPFSTTALVFLTDKWHFNQFMMLRCFYLAISISFGWWKILLFSFVIFPVIVGIFFEATYSDYRKKLKK